MLFLAVVPALIGLSNALNAFLQRLLAHFLTDLVCHECPCEASSVEAA